MKHAIDTGPARKSIPPERAAGRPVKTPAKVITKQPTLADTDLSGNRSHVGRRLILFTCSESGHEVVPFTATPAFTPIPSWSEQDESQIRQIVEDDITLADLVERAPIRFDDERSHAEEIIDILFPGDPLLCVAKSSYDFRTRRRSTWRGHLHRLPLIVPNPMLDIIGHTVEGRLSEHTKEKTARRVYLVVDFDFAEFGRDGKTPSRWAPLVREWRSQDKAIADVCAALLLHLAERLALVCVTHSGGKSLHGWFRASNKTERELRRFMEYAVTLGADHATWTRSQFVRIPDGLRENGKRQLCYYLDPGKAVKL